MRTPFVLTLAAAAALAAAPASAGFVRVPVIEPIVRVPAEPLVRPLPEAPARPVPEAPLLPPQAERSPAVPANASTGFVQRTTQPAPALSANPARAMGQAVAVGFVASADGLVVAPRRLIHDCRRIVATLGRRQTEASIVEVWGDLALLRLPGGPYAALPPSAHATPGRAVTLLGADNERWHVAAGELLPVGANAADSGWPQVRVLAGLRIANGPVWLEDGTLAGIGVAEDDASAMRGVLRLIPATALRPMLERAGARWDAPDVAARLDTDAAMRRGLAASVTLACG